MSYSAWNDPIKVNESKGISEGNGDVYRKEVLFFPGRIIELHTLSHSLKINE